MANGPLSLLSSTLATTGTLDAYGGIAAGGGDPADQGNHAEQRRGGDMDDRVQ